MVNTITVVILVLVILIQQYILLSIKGNLEEEVSFLEKTNKMLSDTIQNLSKEAQVAEYQRLHKHIYGEGGEDEDTR